MLFCFLYNTGVLQAKMIEFVQSVLNVMFAFEGGHLIKNAGTVETGR